MEDHAKNGQETRAAVQRLYADALLSVLSFLPLRDAAAAARTCRQWLSHAVKEPSRNFTLLLGGRGGRGMSMLMALFVPPLLSPRSDALARCSATRQHVTACRVMGLELNEHQLWAPLLASLGRFARLERLHLQLPQSLPLTGLSTDEELAQDLAPLLQLGKLHTLELDCLVLTTPQQLPQSLRHLKVTAPSPVPQHAQHLADAIGQLSSLEHLELTQHRLTQQSSAAGAECEHARWESWLQLAHLHTVRLSHSHSRGCEPLVKNPDSYRALLSDAQIDALRGLPSLTYLHLGALGVVPSVGLLERLCRLPHALRLCEIVLRLASSGGCKPSLAVR